VATAQEQILAALKSVQGGGGLPGLLRDLGLPMLQEMMGSMFIGAGYMPGVAPTFGQQDILASRLAWYQQNEFEKSQPVAREIDNRRAAQYWEKFLISMDPEKAKQPDTLADIKQRAMRMAETPILGHVGRALLPGGTAEGFLEEVNLAAPYVYSGKQQGIPGMTGGQMTDITRNVMQTFFPQGVMDLGKTRGFGTQFIGQTFRQMAQEGTLPAPLTGQRAREAATRRLGVKEGQTAIDVIQAQRPAQYQSLMERADRRVLEQAAEPTQAEIGLEAARAGGTGGLKLVEPIERASEMSKRIARLDMARQEDILSRIEPATETEAKVLRRHRETARLAMRVEMGEEKFKAMETGEQERQIDRRSRLLFVRGMKRSDRLYESFERGMQEMRDRGVTEDATSEQIQATEREMRVATLGEGESRRQATQRIRTRRFEESLREEAVENIVQRRVKAREGAEPGVRVEEVEREKIRGEVLGQKDLIAKEKEQVRQKRIRAEADDIAVRSVAKLEDKENINKALQGQIAVRGAVRDVLGPMALGMSSQQLGQLAENLTGRAAGTAEAGDIERRVREVGEAIRFSGFTTPYGVSLISGTQQIAAQQRAMGGGVSSAVAADVGQFSMEFTAAARRTFQRAGGGVIPGRASMRDVTAFAQKAGIGAAQSRFVSALGGALRIAEMVGDEAVGKNKKAQKLIKAIREGKTEEIMENYEYEDIVQTMTDLKSGGAATGQQRQLHAAEVRGMLRDKELNMEMAEKHGLHRMGVEAQAIEVTKRMARTGQLQVAGLRLGGKLGLDKGQTIQMRQDVAQAYMSAATPEEKQAAIQKVLEDRGLKGDELQQETRGMYQQARASLARVGRGMGMRLSQAELYSKPFIEAQKEQAEMTRQRARVAQDLAERGLGAGTLYTRLGIALAEAGPDMKLTKIAAEALGVYTKEELAGGRQDEFNKIKKELDEMQKKYSDSSTPQKEKDELAVKIASRKSALYMALGQKGTEEFLKIYDARTKDQDRSEAEETAARKRQEEYTAISRGAAQEALGSIAAAVGEGTISEKAVPQKMEMAKFSARRLKSAIGVSGETVGASVYRMAGGDVERAEQYRTAIEQLSEFEKTGKIKGVEDKGEVLDLVRSNAMMLQAGIDLAVAPLTKKDLVKYNEARKKFLERRKRDKTKADAEDKKLKDEGVDAQTTTDTGEDLDEFEEATGEEMREAREAAGAARPTKETAAPGVSEPRAADAGAGAAALPGVGGGIGGQGAAGGRGVTGAGTAGEPEDNQQKPPRRIKFDGTVTLRGNELDFSAASGTEE